jgi:purine-nucleoside phosphorylase
MNKIGVILGSGLGRFAEEIDNKTLIFEDNSGIHHKRVYGGQVKGKNIIIFSGRNHYYEGNHTDKIFFNIELAVKFGIEHLIITNAAGGINNHYKVSDLMLIKGHINMFFMNFAKERNCDLYDINLNNEILGIAVKNGIPLHHGIYYASSGPVYETKAETSFIRKSGADAVGMSTIPEIFKAREYGIKVSAISCITNKLSSSQSSDCAPVSHEEVIAAGEAAYKNLSELIKHIIQNQASL